MSDSGPASPAGEAAASSEPQLRAASKRALGVRLALSLAMAAGFVFLLRAGALPLVPPPEAFDSVRWWTLPGYLAVWSLVHLLRAARWQLLLRSLAPMPLAEVLRAAFVGFLAVMALPMRTGEFVRPWLLRRRTGLSGWSALGTIGAERVFDGWVLSAGLLVALAVAPRLSPLPERLGELPIAVSLIPSAAAAAAALFAVALALIVAFHFSGHWGPRLLGRLVGFVSPKLAGWLVPRLSQVAAGLSFVSRPRDALPFALATLVYWLLNAAGTWLLAWGVGLPNFGFGRACVLTGVLALGILVPNAPGFFGAYQFSLFGALALSYPEDEVRLRGAVLVLFLYLGQLAVTVGFALAAWVKVWWISGRTAGQAGAAE